MQRVISVFCASALLYGCAQSTPDQSAPVAAPPHGLERMTTMLEATDSSGPPVNVLAIVPLNQKEDATLEICKQLMTTLPPSTTLKFSCRNGTVDEISKSSAKVPLEKQEKGVVAILHITEASGRRNDIDAFELLNVTGMLPLGRTMTLCQWLADAAGNRSVSDAYRDVHYTCEVDNNP
jgi:hypothetical protein